ncbi:MAG: transposase [Oscillospiraceae bacterium]|nr:transposase [Oscillospiraceae bacterium]
MELPKRKRMRLEGYDYSGCGAYFVTICVADRNALLWNARADIIRPNTPPLSQYGKIVETAIEQISSHYENVYVDKYCIMPDHVHMIVFITSDESGRIISAPTLSVIIGSMKRWASKQIGFSIWQKSFNDRIIRNEQGHREVWQYIDQNPTKWEKDCFYGQY